jgi:hypothetical protein
MDETPLFPCMRPDPPTLAARAVSRLLWLANSDPPRVRRAEFYAMKDRLLRRWGTRIGQDWQEITRECYACDGTGRYVYLEGDSEECRRCGGSGTYDRFWVRLERWDLAGRVFHRPAERTYSRPVEPVKIVGKVRHADVGRASEEACLWLALAFDRALFRRLMLGSCALDPTWRYPLVTLRKLTFRAGMLARRFERRDCHACGRPFRQGFRDRGMRSLICGRCTRPRAAAALESDDQTIPF